MGGRKIEFCDADSHPHKFVLRGGEPLQALGATAHACYADERIRVGSHVLLHRGCDVRRCCRRVAA